MNLNTYTISKSNNINNLDEELNELVTLASLACHTPIALLAELQEKELILKSQVGIELDNSQDLCALCVHCLEKQKDLLFISDITSDPNFKHDGLVYKGKALRFYASIPLRSAEGKTYGALCILDTVQKEITTEQKQALEILAKKAVRIFQHRDQHEVHRNEIKHSAAKLRKLTDYAPGVIFQLELLKNGLISFPFVSRGITKINDELTLQSLRQKPLLFLTKVLPAHRKKLLDSIKTSSVELTKWRCEIQMLNSEGNYEWFIGLAQPERQSDGKVTWYGTFQNISARKNYESTLKQIVFDISHVLRKPVTTLMGLTALIQEDDLEVENIREFCKYINTTTSELELYTRTLNENYTKQKMTILSKIG